MWKAVGPILALSNYAAQASEPFMENFQTLESTEWHRAHYQFTHPAFDTDWNRNHVQVDKGLTLRLAPQFGANRFAGASVRRNNPTHYGYYEAEMRVAKGSGLITGFFLYSGPAYGTQHDEIDWEFFGKDPTVAQVAWFKDGTLRQKKIELGFDASACEHRYGIEWGPDQIRWFANGRLVFETNEAVPKTPMRLFVNLWAADASIASWAGVAAEGTQAQAKANTMLFKPMPNHGGS